MQTNTTSKPEERSSGAAPTEAAGIGKAARRHSHVIRQWRRGEELPNARAEIRHRREFGEVTKDEFVDLVYEEYAALVEQGVDVDPTAYPQLFPTYQHSVRRVLEVHQWMAAFDQAEGVEWPEPGDRVQNYLVTAKLGQGGLACVYQARNLELGGRLEVIKLTRSINGEEAQIMGRLGHEHIVPVHTVSYGPEQTIIAMPYWGSATLAHVFEEFAGDVQGRTAADILAAADDPALESRTDARIQGTYVEGAVEIARQICSGLSHAHREHIVHGDIKPSNVLITPWGQALLLDFNLSSSAGDPSCIGGTIPYLAPESARQLLRMVVDAAADELARAGGDDPSAPNEAETSSPGIDLSDLRPTTATDIFGLGVLLYELFTGQYPFGELNSDKVEATLFALSERQRQPLKPVTDWNPEVAPTIAALVHRCLAVDPSDRPASTLEVQQALRQWQLERAWQEQQRRAVQEEKLRHAAESNASAAAARAWWRWSAVLVVAVMGSAAATSGLFLYLTLDRHAFVSVEPNAVIREIRNRFVIDELDEAIKLTREALAATDDDPDLHAIFAHLMLLKDPRDHRQHVEHYRIAYEAAKSAADVGRNPDRVFNVPAFNNYAWIIKKQEPVLARDAAMAVLAETDRYWQPHYILASIAIAEQLKESPVVSISDGANHLMEAFAKMPREEIEPMYYLLAINVFMSVGQPEQLQRLMEDAMDSGLKYDFHVQMAAKVSGAVSEPWWEAAKSKLPSGSNLYRDHTILMAPNPLQRSAIEKLGRPATDAIADGNVPQG